MVDGLSTSAGPAVNQGWPPSKNGGNNNNNNSLYRIHYGIHTIVTIQTIVTIHTRLS